MEVVRDELLAKWQYVQDSLLSQRIVDLLLLLLMICDLFIQISDEHMQQLWRTLTF